MTESDRISSLGSPREQHQTRPSAPAGSLAWLAAGLAALGLASGWLIGGSVSPVAGAALPVLLGLGVTASQLASERRRDKLLASLATASTNDMVHTITEEMRADREQSQFAAAQLGKAILAFALPLLLGILLGGFARVQEWLVERPLIPWGPGHEPNDVEELAGLLSLRAQLAAQGFSAEDVRRLIERFHDLDKQAAEDQAAGKPHWGGRVRSGITIDPVPPLSSAPVADP